MREKVREGRENERKNNNVINFRQKEKSDYYLSVLGLGIEHFPITKDINSKTLLIALKSAKTR